MSFRQPETAAQEIARVNEYFNADEATKAQMRDESRRSVEELIQEAKRVSSVIQCERFVERSFLS